MKTKWRYSECLPAPLQSCLFLTALVIVLSAISFSLLPQDSWPGDNFSSLLFNVSSYVSTHTNVTSDSLATIPHAESFTPSVRTPQAANSIPPTTPYVEKIAPSSTILQFGQSTPPAEAPVVEEVAIFLPPVTAPDAALPEPEPPVSMDSTERFIAPLLSWQVGAGNQLIEYMSAATVARGLNRTLCLSPFFNGPYRHTGRVTGGLAWEERYDVSSLSRFTRVASWKSCLQQCNYTLDANWGLKPSRQPQVQGWKKYPLNQDSFNLNWDYVRWQSTADIFATLGSKTDRCVGLYGLFPGLRWRGAFLAISALLQPAPHIAEVTNALKEHALGMKTPYLAVHWRFEESECGPHQIGLCFVRCADGSVIDSGLHPVAKEWHEAAQTQCNRDGHFRGVGIDKLDILEAIVERASNHSLKTVYLATDGWIRGHQGISLVKEIVLTLRARGLTVVGLWKIPGLPNFADGTYFDPFVTLGKDKTLNGPQIALVEQELCALSTTFMGSGQSTWSLAVFRLRLGRRRAEQILNKAAGGSRRRRKKQDPKWQDDIVIETLLKDSHAAGLHCRYTRFMKRAILNETTETYADEYPDGWLDLEACEGRLGRGGHCQVAKCF